MSHLFPRGLSRLCTFLAITLFSFQSVWAEPPADYYQTADATNPSTLRQTLHDIIDDHKRFPYTSSQTDTWDILKEADEDPTNPNRVLDVYRNASFQKKPGGNSNYNREHSWPKSYGFKKDGRKNYPFTDAHHLFISDSRYNSSRSNKPYGTCDATCNKKVTKAHNGTGGGSDPYLGNSNWTKGQRTAGTWETWIGRRGDVARALLYMDVRYEGGRHGVTNASEPDLILTDDVNQIVSNRENQTIAFMGMRSTLLEWHQQDPVDEKERRRNDVVFSHQTNRNPFIDHPEWVACVFENQCEESPTETTPTVALLERIDRIEGELQELRTLIQEMDTN